MSLSRSSLYKKYPRTLTFLFHFLPFLLSCYSHKYTFKATLQTQSRKIKIIAKINSEPCAKLLNKIRDFSAENHGTEERLNFILLIRVNYQLPETRLQVQSRCRKSSFRGIRDPVNTLFCRPYRKNKVYYF